MFDFSSLGLTSQSDKCRGILNFLNLNLAQTLQKHLGIFL